LWWHFFSPVCCPWWIIKSDLMDLAQQKKASETMVARGLPEPRSDHAQAAIEMAMAMQRHLETMLAERPELRLRIGIPTGPVVAAVIGENKFTYDLWGRQCEHCQSDGIPWTAGGAFRLRNPRRGRWRASGNSKIVD
jgi:hypothetical protein